MFSRKRISKIGLVLGPLLFLMTLIVPIDTSNSLTFEARIVLATTVWMGTWWITEAIPIYVPNNELLLAANNTDTVFHSFRDSSS